MQHRLSHITLPTPPASQSTPNNAVPSEGGVTPAAPTPRWRWDPETIRALMSLRKVTRRLVKERNQLAPPGEQLDEKELKRAIRNELTALWTQIATLWPEPWGMSAQKISQKVSSVRKEEKKKKRAEEERRAHMATDSAGNSRAVIELSSEEGRNDDHSDEQRSIVPLPRTPSNASSAAPPIDEHSQSESQSQSLSSRPRPSLLPRRPSLPRPPAAHLPPTLPILSSSPPSPKRVVTLMPTTLNKD